MNIKNLFTKQNWRIIQFMLLDIFTVIVILFIEAGFAENFEYEIIDYSKFMLLLGVVILVKLLVFLFFKLYRLLLDYVGILEFLNIIL